MIIHVNDDGGAYIFVEVAVNDFEIIEGLGDTLSDALRDLAINLEDYEDEVGYEVYP